MVTVQFSNQTKKLLRPVFIYSSHMSPCFILEYGLQMCPFLAGAKGDNWEKKKRKKENESFPPLCWVRSQSSSGLLELGERAAFPRGREHRARGGRRRRRGSVHNLNHALPKHPYTYCLPAWAAWLLSRGRSQLSGLSGTSHQVGGA